MRASVVIPAHNEAAVIVRCLDSLSSAQCAEQIEVVVVANGCTDETVVLASDYRGLPGLRVVESGTASKSAALNLGDAMCTAFPRVYLDADIELSVGALDHLVEALETPEPRVASPSVQFDTDGASATVRAFYRAYARTTYVESGLIGLGVYALNAAGRGRFAEFPQLTSDDLFVQQLFAPSERLITRDNFTVRTPRTLEQLMRVRTRVAQGNAQLHSVHQASAQHRSTSGSTAADLLRSATRHPRALPDVLMYVGVVGAARFRARTTTSHTWLRDESTREATAASSRIAYLVSSYPAPSHTFVEREVLLLRQSGWEIYTHSVRSSGPGQLLSRTMINEAASTEVLLSSSRDVTIDVAVAALRSPSAFVRTLSRALRTGPPTARARVWQLFYFAEAIRLVKSMRSKKLRHVHVHFANNGADVARLAVELGCAQDGEGTWSWSMAMHGPTEFENTRAYDLEAKARDASAVACISDFARSQLMRLLDPSEWPKLQLVPMSVDTVSFQPAPASLQRSPTEPLRILFVGRLVPEKGPGVLLDAVSALADSGASVEVKIVGSGPLASALAEAVEHRGLHDRVELLGALGQDEVLSLYRWADVFCLPSFQEGLPVVLMEAMAVGLPVVTTAIAGIPELVESSVNGVLVPPGRPDLVAEALRSLWLDPETGRSMGSRARERVVERHSTEAARAALIPFLEKLVPR